ncbi:G-type lectin S-receptor-like serine/threonine-protein kinase LECRK3 [Cannabis sativa]|uniref:G-type lectin S-receptor-like serine/threonine-protein kinase LECRK3 n=1 Tax=Cannabis sativa TaxID=3483 RepID=UPI0029CA30CC|nr:G-type lectin S-receptor-like serine/threonine-protein kinase LECRK3 [Cannabis sativa]
MAGAISSTSKYAEITSEIPELRSDNFKIWKERVLLHLACTDMDYAIRKDEPAAITDTSTAAEIALREKWEQSNRLCIMFIMSRIPMGMRGSVEPPREVFSYNELERATEGFKDELGRGLFGAVYKGTLLYGGENRAIAVKRLEKFVEEGIREFRAEMSAIGRTHHRNLVQLLGFCIEDSKMLLVYEFMSNGSLSDLLFKATKQPSWKDRVRLIQEVAKGVLYLHEECAVHIIHGNLKSQNILLDESWTAKISDFGFSRLLLMPSHVQMSKALVEERAAYSAPEWQKNAVMSVKVDVFSFGVVLLETIFFKMNTDVKVSENEEMVLYRRVYNWYKAGELLKLVEGERNVDVRTLERLVRVGLWCTQDDPDLRPLMKTVILMLEGTVDVPRPPT